MSPIQPRPSRVGWPATVAAAAILALVLMTILALAGRQPFYAWYYHFAWYATLIALHAGLAIRRDRSSLFGDPRFAISLFGWSVPAWLLFEAVNFRVANWYYVFAAPDLPMRRLGTVLAFATVFPAIFLAYRWWVESGIGERWRGPPFVVTARLRTILFAAGCAFAGLSLWQPRFFFPLVWGALTLLLEPWNYERRPATSLLADLSRGQYTRVGRLLLAGASVGGLWEVLNAVAQTRWIYTVPGLERLKLFEMPLLGYLGFPVFALDCFVIYQALVNLRVAHPGWGGEGGRSTGRLHGVRRGRIVVTAGLATLFATAVAMGVDRWTVDSTYPRLEDLPGADAADIAALRGAGFERVEDVARGTPAAIAAATGLESDLAEKLVETGQLVVLRGLGTENASALQRAGINSTCELAAASAEQVAQAIRRYRKDPHAGRVSRVRVWLRAARGQCPAAPGPTTDGSDRADSEL